jgi:hypothetical protein
MGNKMGKKITLKALGISALILAFAEINAIINNEEGDTISARLHDVVIDYPVVAGLLVAPVVHFCTPTTDSNKVSPWWQGTSIAILGGALLGLSWRRYDRSRR